MAAPSSLRLLGGLLPFLLILAALALFLRTGDPMVFAYAGLAASAYVLVFFLALRRRRRETRPPSYRARGRK